MIRRLIDIVKISILLGLLWGSALPGDEPRFKVASLEIRGNAAFDEARLEQLFAMRPRSFPGSLFGDTRFFREALLSDLSNLRNYYRGEGYLQMSVADTLIEYRQSSREVHLTVNLSEGQQTYVSEIRILGNRHFSDSLLLARLPLREEAAYHSAALRAAELRILSLYANAGYLDAEVERQSDINERTHQASIDFKITENARYTIGEIRIDGLAYTDSAVVFRELLFRRGEVIDYSRLLRSQRRLYLTSLFPSVFVRPVAAGDSTSRDILIEVKEKDYGELNLFAGYGSVEQLSLSSELLHNNIRGSSRQAGLRLHWSSAEYGAELSYSQPWTLGLRVRTDIQGFYQFRDHPGFDISSYGARLVLGKEFSERSRLSLTYQLENQSLKNIVVQDVTTSEKDNLRTLSLTGVYDSRDNIFNTSQGLYLKWQNDLTGTLLSGSNNFFKSAVTLKYFYPPAANTILASALQVGWLARLGDGGDIALSQRFYAGGPNDIRGFGLQEVGPLDDSGNPLGGDLRFVVNALEVRQAIYRWFGGVVFMDIGNVWLQTTDFRPRDLRLSPGLGIRINTPLGLLRVDYAFNPFPRGDEDGGQLYFSMGHTF